MMESLMIYQDSGGDIPAQTSTATMSATELFYNNNVKSGDGKVVGPKRLEETSGGYRDHSLLPYTSSAYSSANIQDIEDDDIRDQLIQKEKDLILAAELGKALLQKNEELSEANEKLAQEYSERIEHLEQEKHQLKNQLEAIEEEYQQTIADLQSDLLTLRHKLQEAEAVSREGERERQVLVNQLTEQNQRLTNELQAAAVREEELQTRLNDLRQQVNGKRLSMQDHINYLETMKEEITLVTRRKNELEKRIDELLREREGLSSTLDDTSDKIVMLERHNREQETQIRSNHKEMLELKSHNQMLHERLESLSRSLSSGCPSSVHMSLLYEMEMSNSGSGSDSDRSMYMPRRPCSQIEEELEDLDEAGDTGMAFNDSGEMKQFKEEILSAYQQIKTLCCQLRQREKKRRHSSDSLETTSSEDCYIVQQVHIGLLNDVVLELKSLLHGFLRREERNSLDICDNHNTATDDRLNLEIESHRVSENYDKMALALKHQESEIKRKEEEVNDLQSKLAILELRLTAIEEERDTLKQDLNETSLSKEEVVRKAWEVRDSAVKRKNSAEIELAKERISGMQINSQLLEAIQQKVELSQQLDQWQVDMELLLGEQMRERLQDSENNSRVKRVSTSSMSTSSDTDTVVVASGRASRLLSFFQRS